jgi:hypothetical protein
MTKLLSVIAAQCGRGGLAPVTLGPFVTGVAVEAERWPTSVLRAIGAGHC